MTLTPSPMEFRDFMTSRGYHVCRDSFAGGSGPLWYWRDAVWGDSWTKPRERGFIDLTTGLWRTWESATLQAWERGPWHEIAEEESAGAKHNSLDDHASHLLTPFIRACLAAGLTLAPDQTVEQHLASGRDLGNRYVLWQGQRYLGFSHTQRLVVWQRNAPWQPLTLEQLVGGGKASGSRLEAADSTLSHSGATGSASAAPQLSTLDRPPITYGVAVAMAGNAKQRGLF